MRAATPSYPPYDALDFEVPLLDEGDVNARVWVRIKEVEQSLSLIRQIARPAARRTDRDATFHRPRNVAAKAPRWSRAFAATSLSGCGLARTDGSSAAICATRPGSSGRCSKLSIEGNIVADFPLCNKSFNCSYSGHDL